MFYTLSLLVCLAVAGGNCHSIEAPLATFPSKEACQYAGDHLPLRPKLPNDTIAGYICREAPPMFR